MPGGEKYQTSQKSIEVLNSGATNFKFPIRFRGSTSKPQSATPDAVEEG